MAVLVRGLHPLVEALRARGYTVVGPTVRDGAIVLAELESADALPYGWGVETAPGGGCDLRAIAVLDRVLGGVDTRYARRRAATFIVAVACTEPADTCFCASVGCGPGVSDGYDLALTELPDGYVVASGSAQGEALLDELPHEPADVTHVDAARAAVDAAAARMGRTLPEADLHELLAGAVRAPTYAPPPRRRHDEPVPLPGDEPGRRDR